MTDQPDPTTSPPTWEAAQAATPPTPAVPVEPVTPVVPPVWVEAVTTSRRPRPGLRWLVAAIVVVLVAASGSAVFIALSGSASASTVARWAPADSMVYVEARFDLPGDQHDKVGQFLSAFPGFADPASLDAKLAEVYDKAIKGASSDKADYSTDIKPWFGGQVALTVGALPTAGGLSAARSTPFHGAFIISVSDAAKASTWLASVVGTKGTSATYNGVSLTVEGTGDQSMAVGVDGPVLIGGDTTTVHDIIDAKGAAGLAGTADFKRALAATPHDGVGFVFVETQRFMQAEMAAMPSSAPAIPAGITDKLPAWVAMTARFESDSLVMESVEPSPTGAVVRPNHTSILATHLPASTVAAIETHDVGTTIKDAIASYQAIPAYKDGLTKVLDALDKVGGIDSFTSWLGDTAVVVTQDGATTGGGIVVALADQKASSAAAAKFASLKNAVTLLGLPGAKVTTEAHGDATITTIDLGSVNDLLGHFGGLGSAIDPSIGSIAPSSSAYGDVRVAVSYAVTDQLAIVGVGGDAFVKAVLDTKAGSSLADQPRYRTAIERAGASNASQTYVDIQAIVKASEGALPADAKAAYDRDVKPYLAPFDALVIVSQDGDLVHGRFVVTVGK